LPALRGGVALVVLVLISAIVGGATTRSLANHFGNQSYYRPDFRAVAEYIQSKAANDDLIVLVGGHSYPAFVYYYRGSLPVVALPPDLLPNTRAPIDVTAFGTLNRAIDGRQKLWLVLWQEFLADPTGLIVDELEQTYHRLGVGRTFHEVALMLFDVSPGPLLPQGAEPSSPMSATLGRQVRFLGYDLPVKEVQAGETLYLYLYWQALADMDQDYKVFTQVLDGSGAIIAQSDKLAGSEAYPTSHWLPGAVVRNRFLLTVHQQASSGKYHLIVGMYDPGPGLIRLPVEGGGVPADHVVLAEVQVKSE
jgi:hypothetical protein